MIRKTIRPHSFYRPWLVIGLLSLILLAVSCAPGRYGGSGISSRGYRGGLKDNKPAIWVSTHPRVLKYRKYYEGTITVRKSLARGRRYLPVIIREFRARGLPLELAFLPMLESTFDNRANSGRARGLWQFTRQTAEEMGLRVGMFADERLNWRKATVAAAEYLDRLGKQFNYNWALALAAYNGGPGYLSRAMRDQQTWDYFSLKLKKEPYEYVPRYIAMVQVAKERFPHMLLASR